MIVCPSQTIAQKLHIPVGSQKLFSPLNFKVLKSELRLHDYNISRESTIHVTPVPAQVSCPE
mgnify:CR=1 FL=1